MGCCTSQNIETSFSKSDFVKQKHGVLENFYTILGKLGQGTYGVALRAQEKRSGLMRAIKEVQKSKLSPDQLLMISNEISILKCLDHPNIMKIYEVIESPEAYYIVCELLSGGELLDLLLKSKTFTEELTAKYINDTLSGLLYIHSQKFVHNDIKLENLLLESKEADARVKIIDFGISKKCEGQLSGINGTLCYMAPEIFDGSYNEKVDIWSVGVMLYYMLSGYFPFKNDNKKILIEKIKAGNFDISSGIWKKISPEAKDLISKLLHINPQMRLTAAEALSHPWMKSFKLGNDSIIDSAFLCNIKSFKRSNKVVTSILIYISTQMLTSKEETPLSRMFKELDADGNGKLSKDELETVCKHHAMITPEEVDEIFTNCDIDKSGFIDYSEFLTISMTWNNVLKEEKLKMIFDYFQIGKSGNISVKDFKETFPHIPEEDWLEFLKEVDSNNDGNIDLEEFQAYISKALAN